MEVYILQMLKNWILFFWIIKVIQFIDKIVVDLTTQFNNFDKI
jgi:hypothetical protein